MVADTKKAQTLINKAAAVALVVGQAASDLEALRTLYQAQSVDPTGTALENNVAAVSAWVDSVRAVADSPVVAGLIVASVPSHRGRALN